VGALIEVGWDINTTAGPEVNLLVCSAEERLWLLVTWLLGELVPEDSQCLNLSIGLPNDMEGMPSGSLSCFFHVTLPAVTHCM
jgi:hypothetical protein